MMVKPRTFFLSVALGLTLSAGSGFVFYKQLQRITQRTSHHSVIKARQATCAKIIKVSPDVALKNLEFGMVVPNQDGRHVFVPTDTIVRKPGYGYGWRAKAITSHDRLSMKEVLRLPAAPQMWGIGPEVKLSTDRTTATTATVVTPNQGWISNTWWFTEGDPDGTYQIEVHIEGKRVMTSSIEVR